MVDAAIEKPTRSVPTPEPEGDRPEIAQQIEDALRQGSRQIRFDTIEKHFRGKRVWVLDREKMQAGVMRVVDQAIYKSQQEAEGGLKTRQRVAAAITNLFGNKKNITSPVDSGSVATKPAKTDETKPEATHDALGSQIARLASLVNRAERVLMQPAQSAGSGTSGRKRFVRQGLAAPRNPQQEKVLVKILEDNLKLIRGMSEQSSAS